MHWEALRARERTGERSYEAELYRLQWELTLQQGKVQGAKFKIADPRAEAEACFHTAIALARTQQAKSLELRAGMSLSRLWQSQGKNKEARRLLADIYHWFTEGFETRDLHEAQALLTEIS